MEVFLPSQAWIRPWLLQRRITQGLWLAVLFLCAWIPVLLGHERAWDFALMGVWFSLLAILSLPGPSGRILSARHVVYVRVEEQFWWIPANRVQYADLWTPLSRLLPMWDRLTGERKKSILSTLAALITNKDPSIVAVKRPTLERQNEWEWVISNQAGVRNLIPKVGGFIGGVFLLCWAIPTLQLCNAFHILFVRAGGKLWRVDLQRFCSVQTWESLPSSKQAAIKWDILCEISCLLDGEAPSYGSGALTELRDLQVEKEDNWSWKCFYETADGKRKKLRISKGYPDFCPVSGLERSQGPAPARWIFIPLSFLVTAAVIAGFWAVDMPITFGPSRNQPQNSDSAPETDTQPQVNSIPARVPEQITEYEISEVWFRVDSGFQYSRRTFLDGNTGTRYRACVQYGVDASDAWDTLSQYISEYRIDPLYDRFDAVYLDQEPLTPLNETSRYNIVSVYLTDGRAFHTAAAFSDDGALFTMEAQQDPSDRSEDVLANLMFTLESVRFEGPVVTEENYQSQIHVSEIRDCTYMAAAYLKTDLFGHDAYVDVYVPYSDLPIYSSDGRAIRAEAHGLRVYATIVPGENAKAVIDARQQELAATGQVYEEGVDDEMYREDLDAACKLTVYEEDGQKRQAVLYADSKWEGYYLLREITGLPELVDEESPALLKELEGIIGLTMPVLEELGGS